MMRISIRDVKTADHVQDCDRKMVSERLQSLLDTLYPALMNDLDRRGCNDFLYNYAGPSFVQDCDAKFNKDEMASVLMTFVVQNDGFPICDDLDPSIYDVLDDIDIEHELFYVDATLGG